jgi:hypothetical protein
MNLTQLLVQVNAFSQPADGLAFSEGVTVGGGTITNSGTIEGSVAAGRLVFFPEITLPPVETDGDMAPSC